MPTPLVTVDHVSLFLPGDTQQKPVLRDIVWRLERGRHCALIGANGAGKSTLLRLLRGELWPCAGHIYWHTEEGAEQSPLAGRAMTAMVSPAQQGQYQRQAWDITGKELLLTGFDDTPLLYSDSTASRDAAVKSLAAHLHLEGLLERTLPTFSQGQLRLLLLGRALLRAPSLLLLDECADGLDMLNKRRFYAVLEEVAATCTVVVTSHRQDGIPAWCAQRLYVRQGRLSAMTCAPRHRTEKTREKIPASPAKDSLLFSLENVTVFIDRRKVLRDINWSVRAGEHWRITGDNGSGKSTLLRLLAGDEFVADGGRIRRVLPDRGNDGAQTLADIRKRVRLVSDLSQALYSYPLDALEFVCTGFDNTVGVYREYTAREREEALNSMKLLDIAALAGRSIRMLSSGQLRRLFLARALAGKPEILLLDEPCSGLDAESRTNYLDILDKLADQGMHLVFVTHHEDDAPLCINRQAHMEDGRLRVIR
ncbi:MAG: ATP-binding cassette domain-containing protein [Desulfovibrio sp.]|jgi:molybdate transport system ATP-binding protein|nr:ATP-binding cassette domain-containing protein [Desulfovibrio sp.]